MKISIGYYIVIFAIVFGACTSRKIVIAEHELTNDIFYYKGSVQPFTGLCEVRYAQSDQPKILMQFKDGKLHGKTQSFYPDGSIKSAGQYQEGLYSGKWEGWYPSGEKAFEIHYRNDTLHGKYVVFHKDGKIKEKGLYDMNHKTGDWQYFNTSSYIHSKSELLAFKDKRY